MSCKNCKEVIDPSIPFAEFDYTPNAKFEQSSLVRIPNRPSKGWGVVLSLKGSPQRIAGDNPFQVAHNARELYKLNGFQVDKNTLWFNLNIQWLQRTPQKYHLQPLTTLLAAASPVEIPVQDNHAMQKKSPGEWTPSFWQFLVVYTESETYQWDTFVGFLNEYHRMLNPAENALLGNSTWYVRFTLAVDKVKRNPAYTGEAARKWIKDEIRI